MLWAFAYAFLLGPATLVLLLPGWKLTAAAFGILLTAYFIFLQYLAQLDNVFGGLMATVGAMFLLVVAMAQKAVFLSVRHYLRQRRRALTTGERALP